MHSSVLHCTLHTVSTLEQLVRDLRNECMLLNEHVDVLKAELGQVHAREAVSRGECACGFVFVCVGPGERA